MLLPYLHRVAERQDLSAEDARLAMLSVLNGEASTAQIAAFLMGLRIKGETYQELLGFARAMREKAILVDAALNGEPLLDTCGTGGSAAETFNISTLAAFVVAGAGGRVAKHGNRSISRRAGTGSADLLEAFGIRIDLPPDRVAQAIREVGIGFLFAPLLHPAMKHAQPARLELKMRTVFNLLGPLANPAGATRQVIGAPSLQAAELMANALAGLAPDHAFIVYGSDGLNEITTTGPTAVFEIVAASMRRLEWIPADFGVERVCLADILGGDIEMNTRIARAVLAGERGPRRDIVLVNAAAGLVASGLAADLREGMWRGAESIDSGAARGKLEALAAFSARADNDSVK